MKCPFGFTSLCAERTVPQEFHCFCVTLLRGRRVPPLFIGSITPRTFFPLLHVRGRRISRPVFCFSVRGVSFLVFRGFFVLFSRPPPRLSVSQPFCRVDFPFLRKWPRRGLLTGPLATLHSPRPGHRVGPLRRKTPPGSSAGLKRKSWGFGFFSLERSHLSPV